jgi:hypothetical protein
MSPGRKLRIIAIVVLMTTLATPTFAEWSRQTINLRPGWNAVFLEVQPADNACKSVFARVPVKSVWAWNERFKSAQFVRNPDELDPTEPQWLTYFPARGTKSFLSDLHGLTGGQAYLVEVGGTEPVILELRGRLLVRQKAWLSDSFNLMGFHTDPDNPPSFESFFAPSGAHASQSMYRLSTAGKWEKINDPATTPLHQGEAYWIYCRGQSTYGGPLSVSVVQDREMNYGEFLTEKTLRLKNETAHEKSVILKMKSSQRPSHRSTDPGEDVLPPLAGDVSLAYKTLMSWKAFDAPLEVKVKPNAELDIPLAVIRGAMASPRSKEDMYESVIEISDGAGGKFQVPVKAQKMLTKTGLWVGSVTLNGVSEAANPENPDVPTATGSEFKFRIILHVDENSQATLLQEVSLMQVQAVYSDDGVLLEPARYVLITRDDLIAQFATSSTVDNTFKGRRISSPAFATTKSGQPGDPADNSSDWPVLLAGSFPDEVFNVPDEGAPEDQACHTTVTGDVRLHYDDPLNPFVHRFHPDHDNLNERYEEDPLSEGFESYGINRNITLCFSQFSPLDLTLPNWGYDLLGGVYREEITGLHRNTIVVQGVFELNHVIDVPVLNDGQ